MQFAMCKGLRQQGPDDANFGIGTLMPHHQHRAFRVAHDVTGIGTEEIGSHRRPVRGHHDQVGLDRRGFLEDLVIDAALPHHGRNPRRLDAGFARHN